jgi:hypothetical protein
VLGSDSKHPDIPCVIRVKGSKEFHLMKAKRLVYTYGRQLPAYRSALPLVATKPSYFQSRSVTMSTTIRATDLAVQAMLSGCDQILQMPFKAGVAHVGGTYGFTQDNFLLEGASRILGLGADAIFVYLDLNYSTKYPQNANGPFWPTPVHLQTAKA